MTRAIEPFLSRHSFDELFVECLGWDRARFRFTFAFDGVDFNLNAVAEKRGFIVFVCETHRTVLANRRLLRELGRKLRRSYHEHILITYSETPRKQVWQWLAKAPGNRRFFHREHPFFSNSPPRRLLERLKGLSIAVDEDETTGLTDVLDKVRATLSPPSELNLFARWPKFAAQSDRMAMAMRRGDPGAFHAFVNFHLRLARRMSVKFARWFDLDPDDAEQIARMGLVIAASRFEPERGAQFSTYAFYWIQQTCRRYGLSAAYLIRPPVHIFWPCFGLKFIEERLIAKYGAAYHEHFERVLEERRVEPQLWRDYCQATRVLRSSELRKRERRALNPIDVCSPPDEFACDNERREAILRALDSLNYREREIIKLRYGLGDGHEYTLEEAAYIFRVTRERIRQIQKRALEKLARPNLAAALINHFDPAFHDWRFSRFGDGSTEVVADVSENSEESLQESCAS